MLYSVISLVLAISLYRTCKWDFGIAGCNLFRGFGYSSSVITLVFIAVVVIERYYGSVKIFHKSFVKREFHVALIVNLTVANGRSVAIMIHDKTDEKFGTCLEIWETKDGCLIYS